MRKITFILIILGLSIFLVACEKEGPMEKAGEKIDQTVEETKDNLNQAKEKIQDSIEPKGPAEKVGEKIDQAVEKTKEEARKAKEKVQDTLKY